MLHWFWPVKTGVTFFDYWTLSHMFFWFVVGSSTAGFNRWVVLPVCMVLALVWEVFEKFAEKEWPMLWLSPESWVNSWVSDPLMCAIGLLVAWYGFDHWRP